MYVVDMVIKYKILNGSQGNEDVVTAFVNSEIHLKIGSKYERQTFSCT